MIRSSFAGWNDKLRDIHRRFRSPSVKNKPVEVKTPSKYIRGPACARLTPTFWWSHSTRRRKASPRAEVFVANGAWCPHSCLRTPLGCSMPYTSVPRSTSLLRRYASQHERLTLQDADVVVAAAEQFRRRPALGFSDCLVLEMPEEADTCPRTLIAISQDSTRWCVCHRERCDPVGQQTLVFALSASANFDASAL